MSQLLHNRWRQDRLPLLLYIVTFVVMTYPFVFQMHDSLPMDSVDTHTALWQNWWMREALIHGKDINYSELLFHPTGLDLTLQPRRWTTFPLWTVLYSLFGDPLAFNLVAAIGILFKAYGMYLFGLFLFGRRLPAWVCGAFYTFAAPALALALQQPNTGATEWIPWFMLAFAGGISKVRDNTSRPSLARAMILAGFLFSLNAYTNLKIAVFAMLLGGSYVILRMIAERLWSLRRFWQALALFCVSASFCALPLLGSLASSSELHDAMDHAVVESKYGGVDLVSLIKANYVRPLHYMPAIAMLGEDMLPARQIAFQLSHLGLVSFAFAFAGVICAARVDRRVYVWFVIAIIFLLLCLGVELRYGGRHLAIIFWTPYRLVKDFVIFQNIRWPYRMILVFLFSFSILIGYGLHYRLQTMELDRRRRAALGVALLMLFFGTSIFPIPIRPSPRPEYLSVLATLPEGAIVDVPFGRQPSKYYMSVQRLHQRPIVEGMIARMPSEAYDYLEANPVLAALNSDAESAPLRNLTEDGWRAGLDALTRDGFRYLNLHSRVPLTFSNSVKMPNWISRSIYLPPPIYQDSSTSVYDITRWDGPYFIPPVGSHSELPNDDDLNIAFGGNFHLYSWSLLNSVDVEPCGTVIVESWWDISQPDDTPHTLLLVLADADGNGQLAIANRVPADRFTTDWKTGVYYHDLATIEIPCNIVEGEYPLLMGMKETLTGAPLPFQYGDGSAIGTLYYLTTLNVQAR